MGLRCSRLMTVKEESLFFKLRDTPALKVRGFFLFHSGQLIGNYRGQHYIDIWSGGNSHSLVKAFSDFCADLQGYCIVYKGDSASSLDNDSLKHCLELVEAVFVCSRHKNDKRAGIYLLPTPYTDDFFSTAQHNFSKQPNTSKISKVVWRGVQSGVYRQGEPTGDFDFDGNLVICGKPHCSLRHDILSLLKNEIPDLVDVAFVTSGPIDDIKAKRMTTYEQSCYKGLIVMDGWGWPGSLAWCLRSGSIPIVISNHHTDFQKMLRHKVNCFLAKPDGTDIIHVVKEVINLTDKQTTTILRNLRKSCDIYLSPKAFRERMQDIVCYANVRMENDNKTI